MSERSRERLGDVVQLRLSASEHDHLRRLAAAAEIAPSAFLRSLLREAAGYAPTFAGPMRDAIVDLTTELRDAVSALREVARRGSPGTDDLRVQLRVLRDAIVAVNDAYESLCASPRIVRRAS